MFRTIQATGLLVVVATTAALAHSGVQNPAVKARMDGMSAIGKNTKVLGSMAKGEVAFDAQSAREAANLIAHHAAQIPDLFEQQASDPKSEALPTIWQSYTDFLVKADALEVAASAAASGISTESDLRPALAAIGGSCKSCHKIYRINK